MLSGVYASDLPFVSSSNGWGPVKRDVDTGDNAIVVGGLPFAKGLGVHAPSEVVFDLDGAYDWFQAQVGISDAYGNNGSVVFQVFADGVKIYDSAVVTGASAARAVDVPVGGVEELRLVTTTGPDDFSYDVAVWADAQLVTSPPASGPPAAPSNLAAAVVSSSLVKLTWQDQSNSETGFRVERSTNGGVFVPLATLNGFNHRAYDDASVAPLATYAYRVVAFNAHGDSAPASSAAVTTPLPGNFLSDLPFVSSSNGWGPVKRDVDTENHPIVVGGMAFAKGLGVHAPSEVVFDLNGEYDWFLAHAGIADTYGNLGSVVFQVFADGTKVYDSGVVTGASASQPVDVAVGGVDTLRLVVTTGPNDFSYDMAAWGDARVVSAPPEPGSPNAPSNLRAVAASATLVKLSWGDRSNAETGFRVERSTNGGAFVAVATINDANARGYDDADAAPAASYAYRVVAFNAHGDSTSSSTAAVTTPLPGNFLSDLPFVSSTNGWGPVKRDVDTENHALVVGGVPFAKGLGVLAPSEVVFDLNGEYARFVSSVGMSDTYGNNGSVVFQVWADGVKVYDSGIMTGASAARPVDLPMAGVHTLRLVVTDAADGPAYDVAVWGDARLITDPPVPGAPLAPPNLVVAESSASLVALAWDPVANEAGFRIERSVNGSAFVTVASLGVNSRTFNDPNVTPSTNYAYRVVAFNGDGKSTSAVSLRTPPPSDYLSDLPIASSTNGWGPLERDRDNGWSSANDGGPIVINGVTYAKGLGVHAPSEVVFNVNGGYTRLRADLGVSDTQGNGGSVIFQVWADGVKIYDSGLVTGASALVSISVDIEGADKLTLVVTQGTDGNSQDHAVWANARVQRAEPPQPVAPNAPAVLGGVPSLSGVETSQGKVLLTWRDRSTNETSFTVERSSNGTDFVEIATLPANRRAYTDQGVDPSATYTYRVRASNAHGSSAPSAVAVVTTLPHSAFVSDLPFVTLANGWGVVKRDVDATDNPIVIGGAPFAKGLGVHAPSEVVFDLDGDYSRFVSQVGISDAWGNAGSVVFQVWADGVKVYDSGLMIGADAARTVDVDVTGIAELRLVTTAGGDGMNYDVAVWGDARLAYAPEVGAPREPAIVTAAALSPTAVAVTWHDRSTLETGYKIERSADGVNFTQIATVGRNVTSYHDAGASALHTYTYRVRAYNAAGHSAYARSLPATTPPHAADVVYLSDLPFTTVANEVGPVEINTNNGGAAAGDGAPIRLNGVTYAKGLGVSGYSVVTFNLGGNYARFLSDVGVDDVVVGENHSMLIFRVYGDGVKLYDSGTMTSDMPTKTLDVSVFGIQELKLEVLDGGDEIEDDFADWAGARLVRVAPGVPPFPATPLSALATAAGSIQLTWSDTATNEQGFHILRSTNGVDFQHIGTAPANATSYVDATAVARVKYTYAVSAFNGTGTSTPSTGAVAITGVTYLSDLPFVSYRNGYGPIERDMDTGELEEHDGTTITLEGVTYSKGIALHPMQFAWDPPAEVVFDLDGQFTRFQSDIGIDDRYGMHGTVVFQVYADGVLVYESDLMTGASATASIDVDMTGVQELKLVVLDGGDHFLEDHSVWAGARLF